MFEIPIWDLLSSYDGDSKIFSFEGEIFDGFYSDINFLEPLQFTLKIIAINEEIHAIFSNLHTKINYEGKNIKISIPNFERIWKIEIDPLDGDDIGQINTKNMSIDLKNVIREEIIMTAHLETL